MDADVARRLLFTGMGFDSLRKRIERTTLEFTNTQRTRQQPRQAARVYLATSKLEEERTTIPRPTQTVTRCMSTRQMTTTIASPPMECEIRVIAARFVGTSSSVRRPGSALRVILSRLSREYRVLDGLPAGRHASTMRKRTMRCRATEPDSIHG